MKKWNFAHLCAYLSLAISITMLVLWCCNVGGFTVVSLDSFVGVIVALLAIVVTLAIGWQIFNGIEIKTKIEELNIIKERLHTQEKESAKQTNQLNHLIFVSLADIEISNKKYMMAFSYLMTSLEATMALDNPVNVDAILIRMEHVVSEIQQGTYSTDMEDIQESNNSIRKSQLFDMIKSKYEQIYTDFTTKIKVKNDKG
jgi:hypothetical protein